MQDFLHFPQIFTTFDDFFEEFCSTFAAHSTLKHYIKQHKNVRRQWKKNLSIIKLLPLFLNGRLWNQKCSYVQYTKANNKIITTNRSVSKKTKEEYSLEVEWDTGARDHNDVHGIPDVTHVGSRMEHKAQVKYL